MTRAGEEDGFMLTELLIASSMMLVVLAAALGTFGAFNTNRDRNTRQNDAQEAARATVVTLTRQLRNLAGPNPGTPEAVDRADANDLILKAVDPSSPPSGSNLTGVRRMRYCVEPGASGAPGKIWEQTQTWSTATPPAVPSTTACPGTGWPSQRQAAAGIVNGSRPIFLYDSTSLPAIDSIRVDVYVDMDPLHLPAETRLQSGVFLRNQNRAPVADFQWTPGGGHHVLLNGSPSADPESQPLTFVWKEGSTTLGTGIVLDWATTAGVHNVTLEARDPSSLLATVTLAVTAP